MEACELGLFQHLVPDEFSRRALSGLVLGATATAIVMSPWGRQIRKAI